MTNAALRNPQLPLTNLFFLVLIDRFPITTAARTAKTGLAIGITYGLVQDALTTAKGKRPGYVDFVLGRGRQKAEPEQEIVL